MISIIIPTRNGEPFLAEQLEALQRQTYDGAWEVLVVDNQSSDGTASVVRSYQAHIPELHLVPAHQKKGRPYACNTGARAARGDRLLFCDADDVAEPGWVAAMARALEEADAVAGALETKDLNEDTTYRPFRYDEQHWVALDFLPFIAGANMGISRQIFEAIGGFDELLLTSQDIEISWRLQIQGFKLRFAPDAVMKYRMRGSLSHLWHQLRQYTFYYPLLYQRYAHRGMPGTTVQTVIERYVWLLKHIPFLLKGSPKARAAWVSRAAIALGLLQGSIHFKVLYL